MKGPVLGACSESEGAHSDIWERLGKVARCIG